NSIKRESIQHLLAWLQNHTPVVPALDIDYLAYDDSRIY
ncbi:LysR family transcriptional regulator, partial [Escherichia coli]|nr:LysR family transcriptional regulator [Escherichia coli]